MDRLRYMIRKEGREAKINSNKPNKCFLFNGDNCVSK